MPSITITKGSLDKMLVEARNKVGGVGSLRTPYNREQLAKAVFTIAGKEFIRQTNLLASSNKKSFHHVYEWGKTGSDRSRLFKLVRAGVRGGRLIISTEFKNSTKPSPIHPMLKVPGKTGRTVTSNHIFKKKAEVMENGKPVYIQAKNANFLTIPTSKGIVFVPRGKVVVVRNPGGKATTGAFTKHSREWFRNSVNINNALAISGFYSRLSKEIAKELNKKGGGVPQVSTAIKRVSDGYSRGLRLL
jgi:hypothetical protein